MQHDFLDLDDFVKEASKTPADLVREIALLPIQLEGLQMGSWGLCVHGARETKNPMGWSLSVIYIYDKQDFVALTAMYGGDLDELFAEAEEGYAHNLRHGRVYNKEFPQGLLEEKPAYLLLPITEEQAQEIREYDFEVPIVFSFCTWFTEMLEKHFNAYSTVGLKGGETIACPQCGDTESVRMIVHFTGTGAFKVLKTADGYRLPDNDGFSISSVVHAHLTCGVEDCDYSDCVDLNENEIDAED